jgi:hypothetical protein
VSSFLAQVVVDVAPWLKGAAIMLLFFLAVIGILRIHR